MRTTGTVKWYDDLLGLGAIGRDSGQEDCLVGSSAIGALETLREGQRVQFDVVQSPAGSVATQLSLIRIATLSQSQPRVAIRERSPNRLFRSTSKLLRFGRL